METRRIIALALIVVSLAIPVVNQAQENPAQPISATDLDGWWSCTTYDTYAAFASTCAADGLISRKTGPMVFNSGTRTWTYGGPGNPFSCSSGVSQADLRQFQKSTTGGRGTYGRRFCVVSRRSIVLDHGERARYAGRNAGGMATPHAWNTLPTVPLISLRTTYR